MYKLSLEDKEQLTETSLSSLQGGQEGLREVSLIACVAWRFCRAGRRSGVAAKFGREAARKSCFRPKLLPPQSPRGFSALARLHYLARPTKTAMLRRLDVIQSIGRHCCLNMTLFPRKLQKCEISRAEAEGT